MPYGPRISATSVVDEDTALPDQASASGYPFWLWPNLLSLDAPVVAVTWQVFLTRSFGLTVDRGATLILGITVWIIYATDRLLDVRTDSPDTARHRFATSHRRLFIAAIICALFFTATVGIWLLPKATLLGGLAAASGVTLYLFLIHRAAVQRVHPLAKEAAVAILFALGVIVPLPFGTRLLAPWVISALLVWLNTNMIDSWESGYPVSRTVATWAVVLPVTCSLISFSTEYCGALAASSLLTLALHKCHNRLSRETLRVGADLALVLPAWAMLLR